MGQANLKGNDTLPDVIMNFSSLIRRQDPEEILCRTSAKRILHYQTSSQWLQIVFN